MPTRLILVLMLSLLVFSACAQDEPPPDEDLAAMITKAEQGNYYYSWILGGIYAEGEGVPQDHEEAVRWYRLAAEQGFANAQFNLGAMTSIDWLGWAVKNSPLRGWDPIPSDPSTLS